MSEHARRIDALFEKALGLEADGRRCLLAEAGELRGDVERLLRAHESMADDFLGAPAVMDLPGLEVHALEPGDEVGGYTIERVIGTGGGGTVYAARQRHPNRIVALKVMRGGLTTESSVKRFLAEAEILARLQHPGIAHVYEAGVHGTMPYFVMEFVDGEPLRRTDLETFARICDAVHHGHLKGVVHRDLKPGNVLVDADGRPKVIDFGIARADDARELEIMGTPKYMAPELKQGGEVDARTDVYSLGVLLHVVTERRTRDLEAIVARACEPEHGNRYPSAAALATDVRRHARHEPVEARHTSWVHHLALFARRRTGIVVVLAALLAVLVGAVVVSLRFAAAAHRERDEQKYQNYLANIAGAQAALRAGDTGELRRRLRAAPAEWRGWEWEYLNARADDSARTMSWPGAAIFHGDARAGVLAACGSDRRAGRLRAWDAATGNIRFTGTPELYDTALAISPDAATIVAGRRDGEVRELDARTGAPRRVLGRHGDMVNDAAFLPRGRIATASADGTLKIWGDDGHRTLRGHPDRVICVAPLPDGRIVSGGRQGQVRLWDPAGEPGERCLRILKAHAISVEDIDVDAQGTRLATCSRDGTVRFWNTKSWTRIAEGRGHTGNVRSVAISRDGLTAVTGGYDRTVRIWDVASGTERACLRGHTNLVRRVILQDRDREIVSFSRDGTIRFWPATRRTGVFELGGHTASVTDLAFQPGGTQLASSSLDGTTRIWDLKSRTVIHRMGDGVVTTPGNRPYLGLCWLGPDRLLVAERKRVLSVRVSDFAATALPMTVARLAPTQPPGQLLRVSTRSIRLQGLDDGVVAYDRRFDGKKHAIRATDYAPAARRLAVVMADAILIRQLPRGSRTTWRRGPTRARGAALSRDGALLAIGGNDGRVRVFDGRDLEKVATLSGHIEAVLGVAFHPTRPRLATCGGSSVRLWDTRTWQQVAVFHHPHGQCVAFSPDGRTLAAGSSSVRDAAIRIWTIGG